MSLDASAKREVLLRELRLRELRKQAGTATAPRPLAIPPADRTAPLPLSWTQQRLWFIDQFDREASAAYHMPVGLKLSGRLDRSALRAALDRVVARHEVLRSRFPAHDGQPTQVIAPVDCGFALADVDLSMLPATTRDAYVAEQMREECAQPFDLAAGPLIRGRLLRLAETEHVLLLTQHHIVSDGWSVGVLVGEIATLYDAFSQGLADPLPPLPIQYVDYAVWQRGRTREAALDAARAYWKQQLSGAPALLELPLDRPREAMRKHPGSSLPVTLPAGLVTRLRALAQRHGGTVFMTLLAGWSLLLARLGGQDDIVVGTPIANRPRRELEPLLGFFANTLALRIRMGEAATVDDLLAQVKATTVAAYTHQDLPFEEVVEAVNPARSTRYTPLFQTLFTLNNTPRESGLSVPGLQVTVRETATERTPFDLALSLSESGEVIQGTLAYASALFDATTMQRWLRHFVVLLEAMATDPSRPLTQLPLLDEAQRTQLLHDFNDCARPWPQDDTVHRAFERVAARQPQAPAVRAGADVLSYEDLNRAANRVAHRLIGLGVKPDDRVALSMERGADMLVGLLGILKAGGAYVPIDPALPPQRQAWLLEDSAPVAVVTHRAAAAALPPTRVPLLVMDSDAALPAQPEHDPVVSGLGPRNLAYVIYTSGSTGQPKGVMVEHRTVLNLWDATRDTLFAGLPDGARVTLNASLSFDASVLMLVQWLSGHTLVVVPAAIRADGQALVEFLRDQRVDAFDSTPAQLDTLLAVAPELPVRTVIVGGDAIAPGLWRRLAASTGARYHNGYGPTECTVCATAAPIDAHSATPHIGTPLANARVYILDAQRQPVPVGVVGEIYIGGVGVARGYLGREALTAERFLDDPFAAATGARMYRTGDLGCWRDDGRIDYAGRNDFQIKLRGLRIEPGEIESQLAGCEGVREAVVIAREDGVAGDKRLVAYLLAQPGAQPNAAALRRQLADVLPDYMVPSAFVVLPAWPLTSNGKLDRRALPMPDAAAVPSVGYQPPREGTESELARLWGELLHIERVGREDNFFDLGGHSLLAAQLVAHIQAALGVTVSLMQVFQAVTLAELAEAVNCAHGEQIATAGLAA